MTNVEHDLLPHRLRRRPAPLPDDRPRLPVGHRPRGARADAGADRPPAGRGRRLRRRRLERDRHLPPVRRRRERRAGRRRGGRPRARRAASTPPRSSPAASASCTASRSYVLQDEDGQVIEAHSISAGLDYPGVGPEHAYLKDTGRARYVGDHRRRGARRLPAPLPHRGHHPGPRVGPRHRLRRRGSPPSGSADEAIAGQPLRPRRQGPAHRRQRAGGDAVTTATDSRRPVSTQPGRGPGPARPVRIAAAFARAKAEGRTALIPFVTAGYPTLATTEELVPALVARRRRPDRDRRALLRSAGRRRRRSSARARSPSTTASRLADCLALVRAAARDARRRRCRCSSWATTTRSCSTGWSGFARRLRRGRRRRLHRPRPADRGERRVPAPPAARTVST